MESEINTPSNWNLAKRISFRFFFSYLVLYIWPFPLYFIPYSYVVLQPLAGVFDRIVGWTGPIVLGKYYFHSTVMTGSGDTSHRYAQAFVMLVIATVITVAWSSFDRKRSSYPKLFHGLNIYVRYYLAQILLSYGFSKVFPTQFRIPSLDRLNATYAESSPMRLLWTFMGYSPAYTIFTGAGEALAGALLLFKRTRLLGALLSLLIMIHVFMLNMAYDVPVKLFSLHLVVMSIFLIAPDARRLLNLFILNRAVQPQLSEFPITDTRVRWGAALVKAGLIYLLFFQQLYYSMQYERTLDEETRTQATDNTVGEFEVSQFVLNGDTLSPLTNDTRRWKAVLFNGNAIQTKCMDGVAINWYASVRNGLKKIQMCSKDLSTTGEFIFERDGDLLTLNGILNQDSIMVVSRRISTNSIPLLNRKFQWISEMPFNY